MISLYINYIAKLLGIKDWQVENCIQMFEDGDTIPFISTASVENSITCAATALHLGMNADTLCQRMAELEPVAMRLEVKEGRDGCTLINDSYNSDLASLDIALDLSLIHI